MVLKNIQERPLLLIQDGASSHLSVPLIRKTIAIDLVLLCLPPKQHISQNHLMLQYIGKWKVMKQTQVGWFGKRNAVYPMLSLIEVHNVLHHLGIQEVLEFSLQK